MRTPFNISVYKNISANNDTVENIQYMSGRKIFNGKCFGYTDRYSSVCIIREQVIPRYQIIHYPYFDHLINNLSFGKLLLDGPMGTYLRNFLFFQTKFQKTEKIFLFCSNVCIAIFHTVANQTRCFVVGHCKCCKLFVIYFQLRKSIRNKVVCILLHKN